MERTAVKTAPEFNEFTVEKFGSKNIGVAICGKRMDWVKICDMKIGIKLGFGELNEFAE